MQYSVGYIAYNRGHLECRECVPLQTQNLHLTDVIVQKYGEVSNKSIELTKTLEYGN